MQNFLFTLLGESLEEANPELLNCYRSLIENAWSEQRVKYKSDHKDYIYYEKHHILPSCLFPEYKKTVENLVLLTAQEHYLAHKYLAELFPNTALVFAFWRLCTDGRGRKVSAEDYAMAKEAIARKTSEMNTGRVLSAEVIERQRLARLGYKHSAETKAKISASHKGKVMPIEVRQKLSVAKTGQPGRVWTDASKKKLSESRIGSGNPMYGKNIKDFMTEEAYAQYRKNLSMALKGHETSDETRRKIGAKTAARCQGGNNPRAKRVRCIEDNKIFDTISDVGIYYGYSRNWASRVVKAGYAKNIGRHFQILD